MGLARNGLLWISENRKLRETLPRLKFIRMAVTRFMPGEEVEDAIRAAQQLRPKSINGILTQLGENIALESEANTVRDHYLGVLDRVHENGLDAYVSVKPTQLGLELSEEVCVRNLTAIAARAQALKNMVWIDMEQSHYVDRTLAIFRTIRKNYSNVGLCLQAYLFRTKNDLEDLLPLSPAIRLVKGAYREPPSIAFAAKKDVDRNYFSLAGRLLENVKSNGVYAAIATHDTVLHDEIKEEAQRLGVSKKEYEFQMLFGIKMQEQYRLAADGYRMRNLISYGSFWFPWYVRRLAERPANVWFVMKNIFS
jgi:proline dehydrogenase